VQDTFLGAFSKIGGFRSEGDKALSNWLYRITHNRALNVTRTDQYRYTPVNSGVSGYTDSPDSVFANIASATGDPVAQCEFNEDMAALNELPEAQKEALALRIFGYSPGEIAERQNTSLAGAKSKLARGRLAAKRMILSLESPDSI
jgi:RNA polymerase sigma factor (sigma-70 family)